MIILVLLINQIKLNEEKRNTNHSPNDESFNKKVAFTQNY